MDIELEDNKQFISNIPRNNKKLPQSSQRPLPQEILARANNLRIKRTIVFFPLRKHAYSNILKILPPKTESFQIKILIFFSYFCSKIECGYSLEPPRQGGSNEYPQSMFLSRNKKTNVYPCKLQFYCIKVGFKGVKII